ncbi:MAG TPA: flagellar export chaperone FlgN, partial [Phycisphaerales bacterium]|nr:flagellar export chaperone FlgN [Phycisphaerales bacterium]
MAARETEWDSGLDGERLASRIVEALDRQLALFRRLDTLSRRQRDVVNAGDTDQLLGVLGERQEVIEQLERLGEQLRPVRRGWDSMLERLPTNRRAEVRERLDALAELAAALASRDET